MTSRERALILGPKATRISRPYRDSSLSPGTCQLCLLPARDPVACVGRGHVFCRECALTNLLAQKQEMKRAERAWEAHQAEHAERIVEEEALRAEKDREDFEWSQMGMSRALSGKKRKGRMVGSEADWAASKRARVSGNDDRVSSSFWVPGELKAVEEGMEKPKKSRTICPASKADRGEDEEEEESDGADGLAKRRRKKSHRVHDFSLKTMVSVHFAEDVGSASGAGPMSLVRICPACSKALSITNGAIIAVPCGHVLCTPCTNKFLKPQESDPHDMKASSAKDGVIHCFVCSGPVSHSREELNERSLSQSKKNNRETIQPGLVELSCEGSASIAR